MAQRLAASSATAHTMRTAFGALQARLLIVAVVAAASASAGAMLAGSHPLHSLAVAGAHLLASTSSSSSVIGGGGGGPTLP